MSIHPRLLVVTPKLIQIPPMAPKDLIPPRLKTYSFIDNEQGLYIPVGGFLFNGNIEIALHELITQSPELLKNPQSVWEAPVNNNGKKLKHIVFEGEDTPPCGRKKLLGKKLDLAVLAELESYLFTDEGGELWCKGCINGLRKREPEALQKKPGRSIYWKWIRDPVFSTPIISIIRSEKPHYARDEE